MATAASQGLPKSIRRGLTRLRRRIRALGALRGLGTVALVLALGAVLGMAADLAVVLPGWARWSLWGACLGAAGLAVLATVVWPLVRRVGWTDLAAVAERGHPTLDERLTSSVALLGARPHGSPELIAALADEAAARARSALGAIPADTRVLGELVEALAARIA